MMIFKDVKESIEDKYSLTLQCNAKATTMLIIIKKNEMNFMHNIFSRYLITVTNI